jgi:dipeptidyl aminopeptidase/acylaminoacyl peptidase
VENQSPLILKAVSRITQNRGFYLIQLSQRKDPELLSMGPYIYGEWEGHESYNYPPIKAKKANSYLTIRMSATEAPNYFVSNDLTQFKPITDVQPQRKYVWLTTELVHWKSFDGTNCSGILYKPENFDPHIKYPVIFNYYEERTDELNLFIPPAPSAGNINIPWFVSNGYLVFVPDIHYIIGRPGPSAYNSVVSAAAFLSKKPFVDPKRLGIQGHSFGGYETNYIITHTGIFAAACSAAGLCDLVSFYGSIARGSYPIYWSESSQGRLGGNPWKDQNMYIANSPIFRADAVTTPLLMVHNKGDGAVPFAQAVEFFAALRRLGKRVWLLQYDGSDHFVKGKQATEDFTIKMTQFFDHYLRKEKAPEWMARDKQ